MLGQKQAEEAIVSNFSETENETKDEAKEDQDHSGFSIKSFFWHGGSVWDAWFSCSSNQVNPRPPKHIKMTGRLPFFLKEYLCA